jgi:hypothetical protein
MAGATVRESVTLAGRAERAQVARTFVGGVLGPGHPCGDAAALLVTELFGNSVRYSQSALRARRSRSRSGRGTAWSGSRSPTGAGLGRPDCTLLAGMRKAVAGFRWWLAWRHGGAGGGVADGQ